MPIMNFIHLPDFKESTNQKKIERLPLPKKVMLPLSQHIGAPSEPVVRVGDAVQTGTLIAKSKGFISSNLHSSISGKVTLVDEKISIESDGQDANVSSYSCEDVSNLSKEEIVTLIREAGIVGLGGAGFPTHVKLSPPKGKKIDTLIINGAECEPFLTCDYRLMLEKPKEIIQGVRLIAKVLGVKNVIIGVEENKPDAIKSLGTTLRVKKLKTRYPQGGEKQLIKTLLNQEVPSGGLPLDIGCVVHNIHTVFSIYEAVCFRKPLYERVVTVTGNLLKEPKNLLVKIGTPIKDLLEFCGLDFKESVYKIIMGGPMTGAAQHDLDIPVVKSTSGILVMDKRFKIGHELDCIRCSRCIDACPAGLMPCMIGLGVKNNRFDIAGSYDPLDCIECGACSYVCPSNVPLVQLIKLSKSYAQKAKK